MKDKDSLGRDIPRRLISVFKRPGLLTMIEKYGELESSLVSRIDSGDELFRDIRRADIEAIHADIRNILAAHKPYAVCDWCDGVGCKCCKDKGWVGKFAWGMTPRKE